MKQFKLTITAVIMVFSSAASASCLNRPGKGLLAHTVPPASTVVKGVTASAPVPVEGSR